MKHRKETSDIVARVAGLAAAGRSAALATAVRIEGSAYRRPGAKFLIDDEGGSFGGVSGGCLEADVRRVATDVIATGLPRLLHYETGSDDRTIWGLGLGCNGSVDIFLQRATSPPADAALDAVHGLLQQGAGPFAVATSVKGPDPGRAMVIDTGGVLYGSIDSRDLDHDIVLAATTELRNGRSRLVDVAGQAVFIDVVAAPAPLLVCGAGDDAQPLVTQAADVGFAVTVVDHRPAFLAAGRFPAAARVVLLRPTDDLAPLGIGPQTFAVVKTHSFAEDREWVRGLLQAGAGYIGLLGPRARREEIVTQIGVGGPQVFGPAGLDVGADGPEQISVSIVAEMLACRAGRDGRHLREKMETIHAV
jgi:xanthine dehydrogenase accessory factor